MLRSIQEEAGKKLTLKNPYTGLCGTPIVLGQDLQSLGAPTNYAFHSASKVRVAHF